MTREELEHIIRASADITGQYEFIIVGSQAILGAVPNPEPVFTMSAEADIYPLQAPELSDRIDGAIGEGSQFHETHGYYAQGVGPETAVLPAGWLQRVHRVQNDWVMSPLILMDVYSRPGADHLARNVPIWAKSLKTGHFRRHAV